MGKRKQILHLQDEEVAVVFSVEVWRHIIATYELHAADCDSYSDREAWQGVADDIRVCLESLPSEYDE